MKKYFVTYSVNRVSEMTNAKDVFEFLLDIEKGARPGSIGSTKIEVGRLVNNEWTCDKVIGGNEFLFNC